uniref:Uncharacterized protein n=1 Tax=Arundo donax TaxID=35708 RepID=A0A0A9AA34_ARUDO
MPIQASQVPTSSWFYWKANFTNGNCSTHKMGPLIGKIWMVACC